MQTQLRQAVVVAFGRTPYCKARKGSFAQLHPVEYGAQTLLGVLARVPQLRPEDIGDVYVDYDRVKPQIKLDYILTEGDGYVSYELDTAYNFEFTVTTQTGEDKILVVSERSDVK